MLAVAGLCQALAQDKSKPPAAKQPAKPPAESKAPAAKEPAAKAPPGKTAAPKALSPEEAAMQKLAAGLAQAFSQHEAKEFAAQFTTEGEYLDEADAVYHGRQAIADDFTEVFKAVPEARIELTIDSTRRIASAVMAVDGHSRFTRAKGAAPINGSFSFIATKDGNNWQIASFREEAAAGPVSNHDHVKQLEWLVGEWIDEGADSHVHFSCRWDEGGNYLIRDFEVHLAGQKTMSGTQRIGYDPISGHLKSWVFDVGGGFVDGYFHREGNSWILHASGTTDDGRMATGANIYTRIDDHRMTWGSVDRVIGGERVPDIETITIVRKPPAPKPVPRR
jgi:uncharacterized protein (TIGR02246 family)